MALSDMLCESSYKLDLAAYLKNSSSAERVCGVLCEAFLRADELMGTYVRYIRRERFDEVLSAMNLDEDEVGDLAEAVRPHMIPLLYSNAA